MSETNFFIRHSFLIMTLLVLPSILVLDSLDILDAALLMYGTCAGVAFICGSMFADWWRMKGSASSVYKWITILLFSVSVYFSIDFVARYIFIYFHDSYELFLTTNLWKYRAMPIQLSLLYLLYFAIRQRFSSGVAKYYGTRQDMVERFDGLEARILDGELRFEGHSHDGLVFGARLIVKPVGEGEK